MICHDCICGVCQSVEKAKADRKALIQRYAERLWAIKGPDDLYDALGDMLYEYESVLGLDPARGGTTHFEVTGVSYSDAQDTTHPANAVGGIREGDGQGT